MKQNNSYKEKEQEIKLWVRDMDRIRTMLEGQAQLVQPRTFEMNWRYDLPDQSLKRNLQVLRLRQDQGVRLTYKGPGEEKEGVHIRPEIELTVNDFAAASHFLEALGYRVQMKYEKYRTSYLLGSILVTLDEMPYGDFVELEGPEPAEIHRLCLQLGLRWETRILESYTDLFDRMKNLLSLSFYDLIFENFRGDKPQLERLGLHPADAEAA
jgi:adenylate cyclase class 2